MAEKYKTEYTPKEAAKMLGVSVTSVHRWRKEGRFKAESEPYGTKRRYFFSLDVIRQFAQDEMEWRHQ